LPPDLVEHARAFAESGGAPVEPRDAATVILLRDDPLQVYLLRRHAQMAFAAGMYAFPGGRVDPRDFEPDLAWAGPSPARWGERLSCDEGTARALLCAAVRETYEESGVLLAGDSTSVVEDTTGDDWESDRRALVAHELAFSELLARRGLVLRTDLLAAWAHWITPEFEPRRYDTRFFVARVPVGQRPRDVSGEADQVAWLPPAAALAGVDAGAMAMLPPTYQTMSDLADCVDVDAVWALAQDRLIETVVPGVHVDDEGGYLTLPDDDAS
jgi:8-oxo-dGTP pyrophosphatase MutT (NUDIX family)